MREISRSEALRISHETLEQAEHERLEAARPAEAEGEYYVARDKDGYAYAIARKSDGRYVLLLQTGATRNEEAVEHVVRLLNKAPDEYIELGRQTP